MGQKELLETLRREGEERAETIRRSAEAEAEQMRTAAAEQLDILKSSCRERCMALGAAGRRELLAEAEREAALIRLRAESALAGRIRLLAGEALDELGQNGGDDLFNTLVEELPPGKWGSVRVNPAYVAAAGRRFAGAVISGDSAISGGLVAVTADGTFAVDNTLDVRLDRYWPGILPLIMSEVRGLRR